MHVEQTDPLLSHIPRYLGVIKCRFYLCFKHTVLLLFIRSRSGIVCMCVCVYVCVCVRVYVDIYVYTCTYMYMFLCVCVCVCARVCVRVCSYVHVYVCMCIRIYIYTCIHMLPFRHSVPQTVSCGSLVESKSQQKEFLESSDYWTLWSGTDLQQLHYARELQYLIWQSIKRVYKTTSYPSNILSHGPFHVDLSFSLFFKGSQAYYFDTSVSQTVRLKIFCPPDNFVWVFREIHLGILKRPERQRHSVDPRFSKERRMNLFSRR